VGGLAPSVFLFLGFFVFKGLNTLNIDIEFIKNMEMRSKEKLDIGKNDI